MAYSRSRAWTLAALCAALLALPLARASALDGLNAEAFADAAVRVISMVGLIFGRATTIEDPLVKLGIVKGALAFMLGGVTFFAAKPILGKIGHTDAKHTNNLAIVFAICMTAISLAAPGAILFSTIVWLALPLGFFAAIAFYALLKLKGDRVKHLLGAALLYIGFVFASYTLDLFVEYDSGDEIFFSSAFVHGVLTKVAITMLVLFGIKCLFLLFNQGAHQGGEAATPAAATPPHH